MVEAVGRVIWSGPVPVLTAEGEHALPLGQQIFGVRYTPGQNEGVAAPGRVVTVSGSLKEVAPQTILTDFLTDRIYPVQAQQPGTGQVATVGERVVGTLRRTARRGSPPSSIIAFVTTNPAASGMTAATGSTY